nr:hypothetical protein Itr_chr05CG12340 [Ipomoea trifida]
MEMEDSNALSALSAQRSSEDSDLLERSTRKRKVDDGSSEIAMTVPVETHPREETGDLTLATDPPASAMHIEDDQRSAAADPGSGTPRRSPIANALPRSYLDSVVGSGSGAAPILLPSLPEDEVDDSMGDDAGTGDGVAGFGASVEVDDQNAAVPPNVNPAVTTRGDVDVSRRPNPYGSWMIVTRKDHRQTGRPSGSGRQSDQRVATHRREERFLHRMCPGLVSRRWKRELRRVHLRPNNTTREESANSRLCRVQTWRDNLQDPDDRT